MTASDESSPAGPRHIALGLVSETDAFHVDSLVADLRRSKRVIAFVGAGLSSAAGYPLWDDLLARMHLDLNEGLAGEANQLLEKELLVYKDDPLWRAEEYLLRTDEQKFYGALDRAARDSLGGDLGSQRDLSVVKHVVGLPFAHFLTTNYDDSLAQASAQAGLAIEGNGHDQPYCWGREPDSVEMLSNVLEAIPRRIVHIHGWFSKPSSIILSNSHYTNFYLETDRHVRQLHAIIATHQLCFIGFSMTDPHILRILEQVQALGFKAPRHYAVMPDPGMPIRAIQGRMLAKRYGVKAIYFAKRPKPDEFGNFPPLLAALYRACSEPASKRPASPARLAAPSRPHASGAFLKPLTKITDKEDPNRGRFGGLAARAGLELDAIVDPDSEDDDWFDIRLTVKAGANQELPDGAKVTFHLHPTFRHKKVTVVSKGGRAELTRYAWGAFTVGVVVEGRTCLELDLSQHKRAPKTFRSR